MQTCITKLSYLPSRVLPTASLPPPSGESDDQNPPPGTPSGSLDGTEERRRADGQGYQRPTQPAGRTISYHSACPRCMSIS